MYDEIARLDDICSILILSVDHAFQELEQIQLVIVLCDIFNTDISLQSLMYSNINLTLHTALQHQHLCPLLAANILCHCLLNRANIKTYNRLALASIFSNLNEKRICSERVLLNLVLTSNNNPDPFSCILFVIINI